MKEIRSVVLHRGWIVIGEYREDALKTYVNRAVVLRKFDHPEGYGGVTRAPSEATELILDPCAPIETLNIMVLFTNKLDWEIWNALLPQRAVGRS